MLYVFDHGAAFHLLKTLRDTRTKISRALDASNRTLSGVCDKSVYKCIHLSHCVNMR